MKEVISLNGFLNSAGDVGKSITGVERRRSQLIR